MPMIDTFQPMIEQVQAAIRQFATGDVRPYKACWSQADNVTICGGWGAYECGWEQVGRAWIGPRRAGAAATPTLRR